MILECNPLIGGREKVGGKARGLHRDKDADTGGRRKGIPLNMIDGEYKVRIPIGSLESLVSRIAFVIYGCEKSSKFSIVFIGSTSFIEYTC